MSKKYHELILDEKQRLCMLYHVGKANGVPEGTKVGFVVDDSLNKYDLRKLHELFKNRSPQTTLAIYNVLKEAGLDRLVYIEAHTGHRVNEK